MTTRLRSFVHATAKLAVAFSISFWACAASAQTVLDSPELYAGEKALYEAAKKEGCGGELRYRPDLGQLGRRVRGVQKRYPMSRSSTTTSARRQRSLRWTKAQPAAGGHRVLFRLRPRRRRRNVVAPFKPVNFDKLTPVFRDPDGKWFAIHTLTVAFVVNTKLVKNVPQSWADLLKPEYKNTIVYLDPRSTGVGRWSSSPRISATRQHEQPAAGLRLFHQAAAVGQCAARARHHAVRAIREG
jgi:putative spermidine/putrescine transport system substrate-binding protein